MTVQSQLAMSIATCGLTHFLEYATVNFILHTLSSVMIWVTTFLVCLEVMMHYTKCPDTKSNFIPIPPPTMFNVFAVMEISFTDIGLSSLPHNAVCV